MNKPGHHIHQHNGLLVWSKILAMLVFVTGFLVLAGWQFNIEWLKRPVPGQVSMNPVSMLMFIFLGACLLLITSHPAAKWKSNTTRIIACTVTGIGIMRILSEIPGFPFAIDHLLFKNKILDQINGNYPNRMSLNSAFNFILTGAALLLLKFRVYGKYFPAQYLALIIAIKGLLSVVGYLYGVQEYHGIIHYMPMAIHSAVCFILLSLSILFANPAEGIMKELTARWSGGIAARLLIPSAIIVPVIIGLLWLLTIQSRIVPFELGAAMLIITIMAIFLALSWFITVSLNRRDKLRIDAEEALGENDEQLNTIFNSAPDAIIVMDDKGKIVRWNPRAETYLGWKSEEVVGRPLVDIIIPERFRESHRKGMSHYLFTGEGPILGRIVETCALTKSGAELDIALNIAASPRKKDKQLFIGFVRDMTNQKKSEEKFKGLLEAAPDAMIIANEKGVIILVNQQAERMFGYRRDELIGRTVEMLIPMDFRQRHEQHRDNFFANPKVRAMGAGLELYAVRSSGARFPVEISLSPLQTEEGLLVSASVRDITERKETEKVISHLAYIVETSDDAIISKTLEGTITSWNRGAEKLFGYTAEEAIGQNIMMLIPPDRKKEEEMIIQRLKEDGFIRHYETVRVRKDKKLLDISLTISALRDKEGNIIGASKIAHDISQRKKADEKFKGLLEAAPDAMIITDENGKIVLVNQQTETLFGYNRSELVGKAVEILIPSEFRSRHEGHRHHYFQNPKVRSMGVGLELFAIRKNGSQFPVEISLSPLVTDEGTLVSASVRDITERKKSEEKFRSLLDSAPDATVIVDEKGLIQMINRQTEILFGYNREELLNQPVEILIPEELREKHVLHRGGFVKSARVRSMGEGIELNAVKKDGSRFPVEISLSPIQTEEGLLVSASVRDISGRKKLETELKKSNAELEAFTYFVSHDLRAPLRGIIGFTSILEEEYSNRLDEEARRITSVIKNNTQKMGHLIDDLLAFSRMGRQDIMKTNINTTALIREVIDELTQQMDNKIEWKVPDLPAIYGDINTLRQVWVNLISNAIKYSGNNKKQRIEIGSYLADGQNVFSIRDNGVGFDMQYKDKLFKVFQRLHGAEEFEGTGVGLALVEKIVSKHGGRVWAVSEINKGATFFFSIPVK